MTIEELHVVADVLADELRERMDQETIASKLLMAGMGMSHPGGRAIDFTPGGVTIALQETVMLPDGFTIKNKDMLEDVYEDLLERVLVCHDRALLWLLESSRRVHKIELSKTFNNDVISEIKNKIGAPSTMFVHYNVWCDIVTDAEINVITNSGRGFDGCSCGMIIDADDKAFSLFTDGYRHDTLKTMKLGSFIAATSAAGVLHHTEPLKLLVVRSEPSIGNTGQMGFIIKMQDNVQIDMSKVVLGNRKS